ncbi:uncharacterized protein L203_101182 [Cryptococcus depauperatus CBS 7841]|uniref:Checkpoint protein n=1 Tax=Cryptococcus depauperatus CBS 7841 TaxID=1295531 RepID=A0AAJ8JPH6_9TREE
MRFRTAISNVSLFHKIIRSLNAISKVAVIRLSEDQTFFIVPNNESQTGVQVWSQVRVTTLFDGYRIESNSNNEIWVEVNLDSLAKVLRSADSSVGGINENLRSTSALSDAEVTLKLNKRDNQPIWSFEIHGFTSLRKQMIITHEVNVKVLSLKRQQELIEPLCPQPDVHVVCPNLSEFKNIVSRLSPLSENISVSLNNEGTMELTVRTPSINLKTKWDRLKMPIVNLDTQEDPPEESLPPDRMFTTLVSNKALLKFLNSHVVSEDAIMCICEKFCVIAYVYVGPIDDAEGVLTFYIPGKAEDD